MYMKLKKKHDSINLIDLNNILLIISLIIFSFSLYYANNIFIFLLIFLLLFELSSHLQDNKYIRFISNFIGIILLAFLFLYFLDLSFFKLNIKLIFKIFLKVLMIIDYVLIVFVNIKRKKLKIIKNKKRKIKKYTFQELRNQKREYFQRENLTIIDKYINDNNIQKESDYYKVINDNLNNKAASDLEEYVWINYLRFYKNKRYNKRNILDKMNFIFILVHVIILLLAIIVR